MFMVSDATYLRPFVRVDADGGFHGLVVGAEPGPFEWDEGTPLQQRLRDATAWGCKTENIVTAVHGIVVASPNRDQPPIMLALFPAASDSVTREFSEFKQRVRETILSMGGGKAVPT
jgi:hypothetical protein